MHSSSSSAAPPLDPKPPPVQEASPWLSWFLKGKHKDVTCFLALQVSLALSTWIATLNFHRSQALVDVSDNPTPLGYSKSLILFLVPCLGFGGWLLAGSDSPTRRKAFWLTLGICFLVGAGLDYFFASFFFKFSNPGSVLGLGFPPLIPTSEMGAKLIPIEELCFYFLGFMAILLTYIWSDQIMFASARVSPRQQRPIVFRNWPLTVAFWLLIGAALFLVASTIRSHVPSQGKHPFPGYFLFLLVTAIIPSMICSRLAIHFVNFRALTAAWLLVLAISQFWEAALAIPYQWWGYQNDHMMGLFIKAECDLPVEAVLVWTLATWATVMIYETIHNLCRIKKHHPDRTVREALRGDERDLQYLKSFYANPRR